MRPLVVVFVLAAGCGGRSSVGIDAAVTDTRRHDTRPRVVDLLGAPDLRSPPTCFNTCPPVSGSKICLQGQVFEAPALLAYWAGVKTLAQIQYESIITTGKHGAVIRVFDPIDFVSNPSGAVPLAEAPIDDDGCFTAENIAIPFSNLFAVGVDDKLATGSSTWALAALGVRPTVGMNSTGLLIPAATDDLAGKWDSEYNFYTDGSMFAVFLNKFTKRGVEGVVPLFDGNPPTDDDKDGIWKFPANAVMDVFYMAADLSDPTKIVDPSATATTKTGIAIIRKMEVKMLHGHKAGCTINGGESKLGVSTPGTLFFNIFDVEGC